MSRSSIAASAATCVCLLGYVCGTASAQPGGPPFGGGFGPGFGRGGDGERSSPWDRGRWGRGDDDDGDRSSRWGRGPDEGDGGRDRGRDEGEDRGSRGGSDRRAEFYRTMDTNGNGLLEANEVPERMRMAVVMAARRARLDPTKPVSIQALTGGSSSSNTPASGSSGAAASSGSIPGFGHASLSQPLQGFGPVASTASSPAVSGRAAGTTPSSSSGSSQGTNGSSGASGEVDARYRKYAEGYLKQHDANRNGSLEKDEWGKLRPEHQQADTDSNEVITVDELAAKLASYSRSGGKSSAAPTTTASSSSSSGGSRSTSSTSKVSRRFRTATERLPDGLPSWFTRNDSDGDGQVMMHEYASSWTASKAAEFKRYDLNGDGVITPREGLAAENK